MLETQQIKILLIEDNPGDARLIREALSAAAGATAPVEWADRLSRGLALLDGGGFDAVLLDLSLPDSRGLETFDRVHRHAPRLPVVVLTGLDDEELALAAVARGAQDYLVKGSVNPSSLLRVLRFAVERSRAMSQMLGQAGPAQQGKVIGFMGVKGGSGATTVALNVAAALARHSKSVIAIELAPYRAGFNLHLRLTPRRDLADLFALGPEEITVAELHKRLVASDFGVQLLFAPQEAEHCADLDPECVKALLRAAAAAAAFVVIDLASVPSSAHAVCAPLCDPFLPVMERDPSGMAAGRSLSPLWGAWGLNKNTLAAVLVTKNPLAGFVSAPQVAAELGYPVISVIPPAIEAQEIASRQGMPLVIAEPDSLPADSLRTLAQHLTAPVLTSMGA